jgi:hypothetical protein
LVYYNNYKREGSMKKFLNVKFIVLSLLIATQSLFALPGTASATYAGENGQILAGAQHDLVAFNPSTFERETLRSFDENSFVTRASSDSSGTQIAYFLNKNPNGDAELRVFNRQFNTDRLVRTFIGSYPDENGDSNPYELSLSPDAFYASVTAQNIDGGYDVLLIIRISDGATTVRHINAKLASGWNSEGTQVLATDKISGQEANFSWFDIDSPTRHTVVPASALPAGVQSVATSLSPDHQHISYTSALQDSSGTLYGQIREIDIDGSGDRIMTESSPTNNTLAAIYSPDGERFVYLQFGSGGATDVRYVNRAVSGGSETEISSTPGQEFTFLDWAPMPTIALDTTPPMVTGVPDRQPNANGWYNANVTIDWQATDPAPSSGTPTDPPNTTASTEGAGVTYTSQNSCDPAGNCATGSTQLSIDKTAPAGAFTGSAVIIRLLGGNIHGTVGDGLSGVDEVKLTVGATTFSSKTGGITLTCNTARTSCTWAVANPFQLPLGSSSYTLTTIDKASNQVTTPRTYLII